jgi:hypothetical protein
MDLCHTLTPSKLIGEGASMRGAKTPWNKRPEPTPAELEQRRTKQALSAIEWQLRNLDREQALSVLLLAVRSVKSRPC